jgi:hydrogenase expression/formation protein HypC
MCLAVPGRIESIEGKVAVVNVEGNRIRAMVSLVPEAVVGEWVLVHAGLAVTVMSEDEAQETLTLMREKYAVENE